MPCEPLEINFSINDGDPYIFNSKVTSVDVTLSPANAPIEITVNCLNEDGDYPLDSILRTEAKITLCGYSFNMYAVEYTEVEQEGGIKSLSVTFVDKSFEYLDKKIVLIRSLHLGLVNAADAETNVSGRWADKQSSWPDHFVVVGKEYKTINFKDYPPLTFTRLEEKLEESGIIISEIGWVNIDEIKEHPFIRLRISQMRKLLEEEGSNSTSATATRQIYASLSSFLLRKTYNKSGEYLYTINDLIEALNGDESQLDSAFSNLASFPSVYNSYHGTLRDVLNSWGADLGLVFYWDCENNKLKYFSINDFIVFSDNIKNLTASGNIKQVTTSSSIRDTYSKGVVANYQENNTDPESWELGANPNGREKQSYLIDFHNYFEHRWGDSYKNAYSILYLAYLREHDVITEAEFSVLLILLQKLGLEKKGNKEINKVFNALVDVNPAAASSYIKKSFDINTLTPFEKEAVKRQFDLVNASGNADLLDTLTAYEMPQDKSASEIVSLRKNLSPIVECVGKYYVKYTNYGRFSSGNWGVVDKNEAGIVFAPWNAKANIFIPEMESLESLGLFPQDCSIGYLVKTCVPKYKALNIKVLRIGLDIEQIVKDDDSENPTVPSSTRGIVLVTKESQADQYNPFSIRELGGPVHIQGQVKSDKEVFVFYENKEELAKFFLAVSNKYDSVLERTKDNLFLEMFPSNNSQVEFVDEYEDYQELLPESFYKRLLTANENVLRYDVDFLDLGPKAASLSKTNDTAYLDYATFTDSSDNTKKIFTVVGIPTIDFTESVKEGLSSLTIDFSGDAPTTTIEYSTRKYFFYTRDVYNFVSYAQQPTSISKSVKRTYTNDSLSSYTKNLLFR